MGLRPHILAGIIGGSAGVPVNSVIPSFTGTLTAGQTLTYVPGTWSAAPTIAVQWFSNGVAIGGATGNTLDSTGYGGTDISIGETATNAAGSGTALSAAKYIFVNESARALVARITAEPLDYIKAAYDAAYATANIDTTIAAFDQILLLSGPDSQSSVLDLCASRSATINGSMTFSIGRGANTDGSTGYLDSGYLNSGGTHLTQNDAGIFAYVQNDLGATDFRNLIGIASATDHFRFDPYSTAFASTRLNSNTTNSAIANSNKTGLFSVNRTSSTACEIFWNDTSLGTFTATSAALIAADNLYFKNNTQIASGVVASAVGLGASMNSAKRVALKTFIETFNSRSIPRNFLIVFCGQSNGRALFFDSATIGAGSGDGSVGSNAMARVLLPELQGYINTQFNDGKPNIITVLDTCVGGSALSQPYGTAGNWWWLPTANAGAGGAGGYAIADRTAVSNAKAVLLAQGSTYDYIVRVWVQGESDIESGSTAATYENSWNGPSQVTGLQKYFRDGDAITTPIIISPNGRYAPPNTGFDANLLQIRTAQANIIADGSSLYLSAETADIVRATDWHNVPFGTSIYGSDREAHFLARAIASIVGCTAVSWRGPECASAAIVDGTHTDVTITYPTGCAGTDFTPTSGIDGFLIYDAGVSKAISAAARTGATTIRLTHASIVGARTVQYMPDRSSVDRLNMVCDNNAGISRGMPMRLSAILTAT